MEYLKESFTFVPGRSKTYRDNYDRIDWGHPRESGEKILEERRQTAVEVAKTELPKPNIFKGNSYAAW